MSLKKRYQKKSIRSQEECFSALMSETMNFAYSVAKKYLTADDDIQDSIQISYLKAWRSFSQFDENKSSFTTWLYSIIKNVCIDKLRENKKRAESEDFTNHNLAGVNESVQSDVNEMYQIVLQTAERLPPTQKEIFQLRDVQGYSIREVMEITGQTEGSIKSNLYLARKNIKQWMVKEEIF